MIHGSCEQCSMNFVCSRCKKSYKSKGALIHHQRNECGVERRFCCNLCGNRFKHKHHLQQHLTRIHQCSLVSK
ncbi:oocyte zinc finger protein XlCOF26-like [Nasonia vitripennis]|uniref:C2H2-type domain-containing protein n=1 Tax=Nasonia vitripennis TaxID=7425 RepID=A0A7M7M773_NASVI|nr:oocyte zinc finger protein XlCOF26-like [Nasonia vitripennis]